MIEFLNKLLNKGRNVMDVSVTLHAKFRFATRVLNMNFKEEKVYREWQKKNEEEDAKIKDQLLEAFSKCELVYTGKLSQASNEDSNYYVDLESMVTIVTKVNSAAIITCYNIFFDMSEEVDKQTAKTLLKEIRKLQKKKESEEDKIEKQLGSLDFEIDTAESEIKRVRTMLSTLESKLSNLNEQKSLKQKETQELDYNISKLSTKLCYSCQLKNDWRVS